MITDIPARVDFEESGLTFLNLAWGTVVDLALGLQEIKVSEWDDDGTIADAFWERAQRPLATAVTLAQQGTEFLLKARIADVSPFLLLSGSPRDWPKGCDQTDTSYAEFRTADAQDLPRIHDAVFSQRLSAEFRSEFERMRQLRNSVVHTVRKNQRFATKELLTWVLQSFRELTNRRDWFRCRVDYLETVSPGGAIPDFNDCGYGPRIAEEFRLVVDALSRSECNGLLGLDKTTRWYHCPACHFRDSDLCDHAKSAQLVPNEPDSTVIHCFACGEDSTVVRVGCTNGDCPGNVIDADSEYCLSCGEYHELDPDSENTQRR